MLKRFLGFYKAHIWLFVLDISTAVGAAILSVFIPVFTRKLLNDYLPAGNMRMIIVMLCLMLGFIVVTGILTYVRVRWGHVMGVRMEFDMRAAFFRHIQKLSFNYFDNVKTGHLMSRISSDLNMIAEIAHHGPEDLIISVIVIVGAVIAMFIFSWPLAIVAVLPLAGIILWGIFYGGSMRRGFRRVRKKIADINSSVENSVQGIREVKAFANEEQEIDKFEVVNVSFRDAKEDMYGIMGIFFSVMAFMTEGFFFVVIAAGVVLIHYGKITSGDLVAFILYVYFIMKPIQRLINFTEQLQQGAACFERFLEVMDIEPDIVDVKGARSLDDVKGDIKIEGLSFKYNGSEEWILNNINMHFKAHHKVAIVGESGAGKSTIVSLIPRFYEASEGKITIDGLDIMNLQQKFLREKIGIVQQNVFLFDSTIRENIMYGRLDASEEEMIEAAKKANIYDFVMGLPEGFDTLVGERGVKLSGGQKQRISIARVFLKDPPIFIFDEATSALDSESEALIQKSFRLLSKDRTTIVIAHRLSTVKDADYLYVLKKGQIAEQGTHDELIARKGYYNSLYEMNVF